MVLKSRCWQGHTPFGGVLFLGPSSFQESLAPLRLAAAALIMASIFVWVPALVTVSSPLLKWPRVADAPSASQLLQ